ncbi:MAG: lipopolysaccharide kinase InaA family protein, partial [Thermodesulfobacteriota bacterium]|nr:lipopolysaccharide kinase InaA family protein [Thermodesulfobacteriota bacterium]
YKCRGISDTLKYFLRRSKVSSEWKTIHALLDRDIKVARPLAKAERRVFRCLMDSYLITEALVNARPLGDYLKSLSTKSSLQGTFESRRSVIEKVAGIISKIHQEGFFYRDLHAGNILVHTRKDGSVQIYPIDFHKVWHFKRLPLWMRVRDLAQLKNSLNLSQTDQLRFLKSYSTKSPVLSEGFKDIVKKINKKAAKLWGVHLKSRTKRCLVESSEFSVKNAYGMSLYFRKIYSQSFIMEILRTYDAGNASSQVTVLKNTNKQVVSTVSIAGHEVPPAKRVLVKESRVFGLTNKLFQTLTRSRAKRAWIAARGLQVRGLNTPSGLALIEMKQFGLITRTILINEFIENAHELNDFVIKYFKDKSTKSHVFNKDSFISHLAQTLRKLHDSGIYHADLKSNNILVNLDDNNTIHFYFVDLDRVHFKGQLSFEQMANNLAQINASIADCITPRDRLKFFRIYAEGTSRMINRKRYFKRIVEIGRKKNTRPYGLTISNPLNTT